MWEFLIVLDRNTLRKITVLLCAITTYNVLGKQGKLTKCSVKLPALAVEM